LLFNTSCIFGLAERALDKEWITGLVSAYIMAALLLQEPGSVVGIATCYALDGPGTQSRWGRDFPHLSIPAPGSTQPPVQWVSGFSRGKERPGRDADPLPPSSAVVMKG
jgi:hypothetical protein